VNLIRYHGVFARGGLPPNSKHRAFLTPARRGKGKRRSTVEQDKEKAETQRHVAMSCAQTVALPQVRAPPAAGLFT